jgi:hypothetical protein
MTSLQKKDAVYSWTAACQKAFNTIKDILVSDKVLVYPDPALPKKLVCNVSRKALGAALIQVYPDGEERPIAYWSQVLQGTELNYFPTK